MTLYLLVVGWLTACSPIPGPMPNVFADAHCKPDVDFFFAQQIAAKEYAAAPKGSARLFKITWAPNQENRYLPCIALPGSCLTIKELNVIPAQSYEVSDKETVEARP